MNVIQLKTYNEAYREIIKSGGSGAKIVERAAALLQKLISGLPVDSSTTNNGETRIRNCVKYGLSDGYRLITLQEGQTCFVLYVGSHDDCDRWLNRHRGYTLTKDKASQNLRFVNPITPGKNLSSNPVPTQDNIPFLKRLDGVDWESIVPEISMRYALLHFNEDQIDDVWIFIAQAVQPIDENLATLLSTVFEHLIQKQNDSAHAAIQVFLGERDVADEWTTLDEFVSEEVIRSDENAEEFILLNDLTEDEYTRLFDPVCFQEWMVYLHPGQKRIVHEDFQRPGVLTGVSGSGKTCIIAHRASRIAGLASAPSVLVITLNKSLARLIENLILQLCGKDRASQIDVLSFHDYLADILRSLDPLTFLRKLADYTGQRPSLDTYLEDRADDTDASNIFRALDERDLKQHFLEFSESLANETSVAYQNLEIFLLSRDQSMDVGAYIYEELELVRSAFPCFEDYSEYLSGFERTGRAIRLGPERRSQILAIMQAWEGYQLQNGFLDHMGLSQAALLAVEENGSIPEDFRYDHILVDEFQDFSTLDFRVLGRIPRATQNAAFYTGDIAQKLYAKEFNLSKVGLGPESRSLRRIRKNYRNSKQILQAAQSLLDRWPPTGGVDSDLEILQPEYAARESAKPIAHQSYDPISLAWREAQDWLRIGNLGFSVCITTAAPDTISVEDIMNARPLGIKASGLSGDYMLDPECVVVSDIASIKGFEFTLVIILGLENDVFPPSGRPDDETWRDAMRLYVAITRGRDEVRFIYTGTASRFLTEMGTLIQWKEEPLPEPVMAVSAELVEPRLDAQDKAPAETLSKTPESFDIPPPEPESEMIQPSVSILHGRPTALLRQRMSQRDLAEAFGVSLKRVSLFFNNEERYCVTPVDELPDHMIRRCAKWFGITVAFKGGDGRIFIPVAQRRNDNESDLAVNEISDDVENIEIINSRPSHPDRLKFETFSIEPIAGTRTLRITGFDGTLSDAISRRWNVETNRGLKFIVSLIHMENGERQVYCSTSETWSGPWPRIVGRLRQGIRTLNEETLVMDLRQARLKANDWSNRFKANESQLDEGAGVSVKQTLLSANAIDFGTKEDVYGETNKTRTAICATFSPTNEAAPVAAYVMTTILPLQNGVKATQ